MAVNILSDADIADLIKGTQHHLGKNKFTSLMTDLQHHEAASRIMTKDKIEIQGGDQIQRNIAVKNSDNARQVGMFQTDDVSIPDLLQQIKVPWKHTVTEWAWERREALIQVGQNTVLSTLKLRRAGALVSQADHMEAQFWSKPASSSNELECFGVPYWVVSDTTTAAGAFNGGNPSGFTSGAGGLDSSTYTRWKNYTFNYSAMTDQDALAKMRRTYRKINFKSPIDVNDYRKGNGSDMRIYMDETTLDDYESLVRKQNDNLGNDAAKYQDETVFKRTPVVWCPYLDDNSSETNPIYFLNFNNFHPIFLKGDVLRETEQEKAPGQHNVFVVYVDTTWNLLCTDRRAQAVGTKV